VVDKKVEQNPEKIVVDKKVDRNPEKIVVEGTEQSPGMARNRWFDQRLRMAVNRSGVVAVAQHLELKVDYFPEEAIGAQSSHR